MRKLDLFAFISLASVLMLVSCVHERFSEDVVEEGEIVTITAYTPQHDTKTMIDPEDSNMTRILWNCLDSIKVFYGSSGTKFLSANSYPESVCQFVSTSPVIFASHGENLESHYLLGIYPYDSSAKSRDGESVETVLPYLQYGKENTFSVYPSLGRSYDYLMRFYNICGGIRFFLTNDETRFVLLTSNDGTPLSGRYETTFDDSDNPRPYIKRVVAGNPSVVLEAPSSTGGCFKANTWYYITMLPDTLKSGFTAYFIGKKSIGTYVVDRQVVIKRSSFHSIPAFDSKAVKTTDELDADGSANCYFKHEAGPSRFRIDTTEFPTAHSAVVVWESDGTKAAQTKKSLIQDIDYAYDKDTKNRYVYISTNGEFKEGNALVSLLDKMGVTLHSWHIWLTGYTPSVNDKFMDRNLGALSAEPGSPLSAGLMYQWGRPYPFMGVGSSDYSERASSTLKDWRTADVVVVQEDGNTSVFSKENPTVQILSPYSPRDWYCPLAKNRNDSLWTETVKSEYDPCPPGWKVPSVNSAPWSDIPETVTFDKSKFGISYKGYWYPAGGYVSFTQNCMYLSGSMGGYWTSTKSGTNAVCLYFDEEGDVQRAMAHYRAVSLSVRCVKYTPVVHVTGIQLNKNELTLDKGQSESLTATILPSDATNQNVSWMTDNNAVATVDSTGNVTAIAAGTANITVTSQDGGKTDVCAVTVKVPVDSVTLDKAAAALIIGESLTLNATVNPSDATDKSVSWSSNAANVASVDQNGKLEALAEGQAIITVTTNDGSKTAACAVTVSKPVVHVTSVTLDRNEVSLHLGDSLYLSDTVILQATVAPGDATDKSLNWASLNPEIATVDNGKVKPVALGTTKIIVKSVDGEKADTCTVTVVETVHVTGVALDQSFIQPTQGQIVQLTATVTPENARNTKIIWYSDNEDVATVDEDGNVTAVSATAATPAMTVIHAKSDDNPTIIASCAVLVNP